MTSASYFVDLIPINAGIGPDAIFEGGREAWLQKIIDICYPDAASDDGNPHIFIHPVPFR